MAMSASAGRPAPPELLEDLPRLVSAYYLLRPDPAEPGQRVAFGTSGHRGSALAHAFNQEHVWAICQAICEHRAARGIDGPLFLGKDTHALSEPAQASALEVLAAHGVTTLIAAKGGHTPTPVISHAILAHNRGRERGLADGIVITPSHNPPADGGIKYNPPHGGPAEAAVTAAIEKRANQLLAEGGQKLRRLPYERALRAATTREHDYLTPYVADLVNLVDLPAVAAAGLRLGVDPLGGASLAYWEPIAERYRLDLTVVNRRRDPAFAFMPLDHDGVIRMDCSSPQAMAGLLALKDRFDLAFGNDPDADRHGIVTPGAGLLNPNHYLAAAIDYLLGHRPGWPAGAAVGKTLVSSSLWERVAAAHGRAVCEVPVGFKWFVPGLLAGGLCFGGEESAGASFLRTDGTVWTTDKDGLALDLLAAELTARLGQDPGRRYAELADRLGRPYYARQDAPASPAQKRALANLGPELVTARELAGEPILARLTAAPGNQAPLGGLKVVAQNGWFAARPSGTEAVYKIYAESFLGAEHLAAIQAAARAMVDQAFAAAGVA